LELQDMDRYKAGSYFLYVSDDDGETKIVQKIMKE